MDERHHIVRKLRLDLGLTQEQFGARIGLSAVRICQIERSGAIGVENALKIEDAYGEEMRAAGISLSDILRNSKVDAA